MHDTGPYQRLWADVLLRAVSDAIWPWKMNATGGSSGVTLHAHRQAKDWFGSRDFHTVCRLAGFDPEFIMSRIGPLLDAPVAEREAFIVRISGDPRRQSLRPTRLQASAAKYREAA